jgi:L-aspartate oxidase
MECLVFARQLRNLRPDCRSLPLPPLGSSTKINSKPPSAKALSGQIAELRSLCWEVAGLERRGHTLRGTLEQVRRQRNTVEADPCWRETQSLLPGRELLLAADLPTRVALLQELHQRLLLAELLIEAGLFRQESRGGHFRTDCPAKQPFWQCHSVQRLGREIGTAPVGMSA